jgi:membrane protein DedA with SNARE-associated domain/rhodanese-related sulfurtransferase
MLAFADGSLAASQQGSAMDLNQAMVFSEAHGVLALCLLLFAKRMGVPVPALPFLLLAGARGAADGVFALSALVAGSLASVLADAIWFIAGRRYGRSVLALMCRISVSPGSCIRKSELAFARRGAMTVLLAKFIPGVAGLAPPLAGALGMRSGSFTALNGAGTVLWVGSGMAAGLVFHRQLMQVVRTLQEMGAAAVPWLLLAIAAYIVWLVVRRLLINRAAGKAPRLHPHELADKLARGEKVMLVDVRGAGAELGPRIPGALHAFLDSAMFDGLPVLPEGMDLVTYCDCPNDISAARAALRLRKRGIPALVLAGGFPAWEAAGFPVETSKDAVVARDGETVAAAQA